MDPPLTEHQAARILNVKVSTLRRLRSLGLPPECYRIAGHPRYSMTTLKRFVEESRPDKRASVTAALTT